MKYILFIIPIILISLCVQIPGIQLPEIPFLKPERIVTEDMGNSEIFIKAEASASEIRAGRSVQVIFELTNKQLYDLKNVNLTVYDHSCFPDSVNQDKFKKYCENLRSNESCSWYWRWTSESSNFDRRCTIRFKTSYEATNSVFQDIAVLPESEYFQREMEGTLKNIPIQHTSAKGPLDIWFTFSEPQPLVENQAYDMYINYYNRDEGFFEDLNITINIPDNMKNIDCGEDYKTSENKLVLSKELKFIKGRAVPTRCNFTTKEISTISIRTLTLTTNYKYVIYNSIPITVKA